MIETAPYCEYCGEQMELSSHSNEHSTCWTCPICFQWIECAQSDNRYEDCKHGCIYCGEATDNYIEAGRGEGLIKTWCCESCYDSLIKPLPIEEKCRMAEAAFMLQCSHLCYNSPNQGDR